FAIEAPRVDGGVALAAEVEAFDVEVVEVFLAADLAARVVVEVRDAAGAVAVVVEPLAASDRLRHRGLTVLLGQRQQLGPVEPRRIRVLERVELALLPVADQIGGERASAAHAAR